jgi:signal transduction histidine kinase
MQSIPTFTRIDRLRIWLGHYSLSKRVRVLMALVNIFSVLVVSSSVVFFVYRSEQTLWEARQHEASQNGQSQVNAYLEQMQIAMFLFGSLGTNVTVLEHLFALDPDALSMDEIVLDGPNGMAIQEAVMLLDQTLLEVVWVDQDGQIISDILRTDEAIFTDSFDLRQAAWFDAARQDDIYWGDVQLSPAQKPYLILAAPARGEGVVAARLDAQILSDIVRNIQLGDTGKVYVVNQNRQVVAHPDLEIVINLTQTDHLFEMDEWRGSYTDFYGERVQGTANPVGESGWWIVTEISRHEATSLTRQTATLLPISLVILGLILYGVLVLSVRFLVLTPLETIRRGAFQMGLGHLDERITIPTHDEFGGLAEEFNRMAANLEQKIRETEFLAQKATEASEFKSNLISRVSHELRNPLGGILGLGEMLEQGIYGPINAEQQEATRQIIVSAEYLAELVEELLTQSRLEQGRVGLELTEFNPKEVIDRIVALSKPSALKKGIELTAEFDENLPATVVLDQGKLEQVIANLVSNAVKFTEHGWVRVHVMRGENSHWIVQVQDTGIGIPAHAQQQIFDPFRQVDESINRKYGGFGLGLSIVKQMATLINGQIAVESTEGIGSCFTVTWPYRLDGQITNSEMSGS